MLQKSKKKSIKKQQVLWRVWFWGVVLPSGECAEFRNEVPSVLVAYRETADGWLGGVSGIRAGNGGGNLSTIEGLNKEP